MKIKCFRPVLSLLLCAAMLCAMAVPGLNGASAAGDTYEKTENVTAPGFETGGLRSAGPASDAESAARVGCWTKYNNAAIVTEAFHGGSHAVKLQPASGNDGTSLEQDIVGLQTGLTYVYTAWVKVATASQTGDPTTMEVSVNGGKVGTQRLDVSTAGDWTQYSIEFSYSTEGTVRLSFWNPNSSVLYVDDVSLKVKGDVDRAQITNGAITVAGNSLNMAAFTAVYTSSLNTEEAKTLPLTAEGDTLRFSPIAAAPLAQTIRVILSYQGVNIPLEFTIDADANAPVVAPRIESLQVTNGTAVITLAEKPTLAPQVSDMTFALTVDGVPSSFRRSGFAYDNNRTVTVTFTPVSASVSADRAVALTVTCGGVSRTERFTVAQGTSRTYYVSKTGSDQNDGLTPETALRTIDKLNTLSFGPGDHILFKSGDDFEGMFRPRGSGNETAPIIVGKYGGETLPILRPDPDGAFDYALGAGTVTTRRVNGTIWLENVEYWEIHDLELHDPSYDPDFFHTGNLTVYNAGVRVVNVDQGDLSHFVFDNLKIHGFRGPGINPGKTSGGIQFNVGTQAATPVPSCFVDVSITNCNIFQCGRDGINSLTVWGYRRYQDNGAEWPSFPFQEYNRAYAYYPNRNLYVAGCTIREIDGDGMIVDTWDNTVVEHNLVTRCAIHLSVPFQAAVGLFNWNADNTVFQYNECAFNGVDATRHTIADPGKGVEERLEEHVTVQDGQGIEVDALNQNTWVQFNYLHDNAAFMMLCTETAMYTSINSYIRYNVTENDGCNLTNTNGGMSWFLNGNHGRNTQVYNNTCVLGANALKNGQLYLLKYNSDQYKFYNNIFYYTGAAPVRAVNWQNNTDWQSNLFINIDGLPDEDNSAHPNLSLDRAKGAALFTGGTGADAYRLTENTYAGRGALLPSMKDGMFSGVDMAGNPVPETPGLGAFVYVD